MLVNGLALGQATPVSLRRRGDAVRRQPVEVQVQPRERPDEVRAAPLTLRVQRRSSAAPGAPRSSPRTPPASQSMPLLDTTRPSFIGYSSRMAQGDELDVGVPLGQVEAATQRRQATASSRSGSSWSRAGRRARPGAAARVKPPMQAPTGWTERPPSRRRISLPAFFRRRPRSTAARSLLRQVDHALAAEEVGRRQHVDVQGVALDPFAAVVEPAQRAHRRVDGDAEGRSRRARRSSDTRPDRCRRCGR